jgi:hypothetical protein
LPDWVYGDQDDDDLSHFGGMSSRMTEGSLELR